MNQKFSKEYFWTKSPHYNRLPNLTNNNYLNLSQELNTSRTKKNLAQQKLHALSNQKDDSNNYYHHTTIYNIKLNKETFTVSNNQELSFSKYNEIQTKLMISDFKKKVDAFLKKNNYKSNLISNKIASSSKEQLQQIKYEESLNKFLCSNKYTVQTEKKSIKTMEIYIQGTNKIVSKQVISSELLQQRLLKQKETFLKDDRFNYDLKMTTMMKQYAEIVNRIQDKAFTIKIPDNYIIQMSDYNEYYQIKEDSIDNFLENKLEIIADQIIHEIQQSKITTPKILSNQTSKINESIIQNSINQIEHNIQTQPTIIQEQEILKNESDYIEQNVPKQKISNKKVIQKQNTQQNKKKKKLQEQFSLLENFDSSLINSNIRDNHDTHRRNIEITKIEEEQDLKQKESEKQKKQLIIKKLQEFNQKFKPNIYLRRQSERTTIQIQDQLILVEEKERILKTFSLRTSDNITIMNEILEIIRIKKQQLYEYQQEQLRQQEQYQLQYKNNGQQRPLHLIVNGKPFSEIKETELLDSLKNSPMSFKKQRQLNIPNTQVSQSCLQQMNMIEESENQVDSTKNLQENNNSDNNINDQQQKLEEKLKQQCQDIFDILLASDSVYDLRIDDYQIGKPHSYEVNYPNIIFLQEQDEILFIQQVLWKREIQQVIPKLNSVNKQISFQVNSEDEYIQDSQQLCDEEQDNGHYKEEHLQM